MPGDGSPAMSRFTEGKTFHYEGRGTLNDKTRKSHPYFPYIIRNQTLLFTSVQYFVFLTTVVILAFLLPYRFRWLLLLVASYFYYATWNVSYIVILLGITLVIQFTAIQMSGASQQSSKKRWLLVSLFVNLGLLFFFKYSGLFGNSLSQLFGSLGVPFSFPVFDFVTPVGISFYTFQALSYSFDVYRGKLTSVPQSRVIASYVAFFPSLLSGPIGRSTNFIPQLLERKEVDESNLTQGMRLILFGLFKKIVVADNLGLIVDAVYIAPSDVGRIPLLITTYLYTLQIYTDFSGYTDIAIGSAKMLGYDLLQNFRQPYFASSIRDFWHRWHISLTTWLRDYLYIPLGGNRVSTWRWYTNILVVFVLSGIWHGAGCNFLIWGLLHGLFLLVGIWTTNIRQVLLSLFRLDRCPVFRNLIGILVTFHLVSFAWIFFRAKSIHHAVEIITNLFQNSSAADLLYFGTSLHQLVIGLVAFSVVVAWDVVEMKQPMSHWLDAKPRWIRWLLYYVVLFSIISLGPSGRQDFIYFQF
jgi:alginate O-acetyltransferase complex protein AlgI